MAKTAHNTGLSLKRNKNKFTASWKLKAKNIEEQKVRFRTYNGKKWSKWTTKKVSKKATTFSFSLSPARKIKYIQVQTQVNAEKHSASSWDASSDKFTVKKPPAPSLTVTNNSANSTTFSWSISSSDTNDHWYYRCYYRTKCDEAPDSDDGWSDWAYASQSSYTYTDNDVGETRIFQIYAKGPGGKSTVRTERHIIGTAPAATWGDPPVSYTEGSSYYEMTYNVNIKGSTYAIDKVIPQYLIDTPTSGIEPASGVSWVDGSDYSYDDKKENYTLDITTAAVVGLDECLWARVKTEHDNIESYSDAYRVITGALAAPSATISMGTPTQSGFTVSITVDDAVTDVPGAYIEVYLEKASATGLENYILIGTIANGTSSASISSSIDLTGEPGYSIHIRNVTADGISMVSGFYSYTTSMPTAPTLNSVDPTTTAGKVYLKWTTNWSEATGTIIAWTQDPDNWMSNDEPETYEVTELASNWFIVGLETGVKWYFRVRSIKEEGDSVTYSPWSADMSIDLAEAPAVPVLYLSSETITEDGMVTAYWSYVSTDGTAQIAASIVEATNSGGVWTYGDPIEATTTAQHIDIYAADKGWQNGDIIYLALQTRSGSGGQSEYSTPVPLVIAAKPTVAISSTGLAHTETVTEHFRGDADTVVFDCAYNLSAAPTVTVDGEAVVGATYSNDTVTLPAAPADGADVSITYTTTDNEVLTAMPFTATVTTTNAKTLTVAIERAVAYQLDRPDGTTTEGPQGETIYVDTDDALSSNSLSIELNELLQGGHLDDGAWYYLVVTAADAYGQNAEARKLFKVHWSHQAWEPTAHFHTDFERYAAEITPVAGGDYVSGDTCDIYRLGFDAPEMIYSGAAFGQKYVDPYPAFGQESGYKVVTVTENGDYITEDDTFAEYDTTQIGGYPQLNPGTIVIDFDQNRIELPYNITLNNSWTKDFERTVYLGGHVTGDHNKAVTRDLGATSVLVRGDDEAVAMQMRALARYAGLCHVRTPEGSSFTADIQVAETQAFNTQRIDYSITIQKVDTVGFDGMTWEEWRASL